MRHPGLLLALVLAGASAGLAASPARAADDPARRGFDPDPVRPALSLRGAFTVESAEPAPEGARAVSARLEYTRGLLALRLGGERDALLEDRWRVHVGGGFSFGRWELAASLPLVLAQRADFGLLERQGVTGPLVAPVSSTAQGDLRLGGKYLVLGEDAHPVGLAATAELRLPTGNGDAFAGDGLGLRPGLVVTRHLGERARVDLQAGYDLRDQGQYAQLAVHDGFVYGLAATVALPPLSRVRTWHAIFELTGGVPRGLFEAGAGDRYRAPLSARAGLRALLGRRWEAELGVGRGLGEAGYGREAFRIFAGLRAVGGLEAAARPGDRDGDGVPDATDRCPDEPGDAALDGCPDRDGDEIADREDACPDRPGPAENKGCPPEGESLVEIETERLSLKDAIHFDTGKDTIKAESSPILEAIARLLGAHPELERIRVEGHTDNVGGAGYNKDLSRRRAAAVVRDLVSRGVAAGRLVSEGYGFERPVAPNDTTLNRARNRRVEFTILSGR